MTGGQGLTTIRTGIFAWADDELEGYPKHGTDIIKATVT
jgi:hypothetical protein